jgi:C1A family cysteine protease
MCVQPIFWEVTEIGEEEKAKEKARVKKDLAAINKAIKVRKLRWKAGETAISKLSEEEQANIDGSLMTEERMASIIKRQKRKEKKGNDVPETDPMDPPPEWDWRNVSGVNWTTPPKAQGGCGSCVAHAVAGVVEMMIKRWIYNDPTANPDLSEAHLFFCNNRQCIRGQPRFGWWISDALNYVKDNGIPDEGCYPYIGQNQPCNTCTNWRDRINDSRITHWQKITDRTKMKTALSGRGCLVADLVSYRDLKYYTGGIYEHAWGEKRGGHAVMVVGYNDADGCWICKNSWGTWWGENGFFRIAYGECGIDDAMCAVDFVGVLRQTEGRITYLRVHDVKTKYGPDVDQLDAEVIVKLDSNPDKTYGFQLRNDSKGAEHQGMLGLLRDAFKRGTRVRIEYTINGLNTGLIIRLVSC